MARRKHSFFALDQLAEEFSEPDTIPCHIVATGGAEGDETAFTVPESREFKLRKVICCFPIGTYGELEISLKKDGQTVFPLANAIKGDGIALPFKARLQYESGKAIVIHYKNLNSSETRECFVFLCGELK